MSRDPSRASSACRLPEWLWLWFPPLLLFVIIPVRILDPSAYRRWIDGELGLIELATPLLAIGGLLFGIAALKMCEGLPGRAIKVWILLLTLGCGYLAGEELSWGQQLFNWHTPEYIGALNDQKETNLHNMSSWFDQKPRMLLEIWVLIGGIIVPTGVLLGYGKLRPWESSGYWFWPTVECLPTAVLAILIRLPERMKPLFGLESLPFEIRFSEPQEYYFAMFLMIYLASVYWRLRDQKPTRSSCG